MLAEMDTATLPIADNTGALPIHSQGGFGTLAARNRDGAMPLHILCGSTNPSLRTVQFLDQSFPGSVEAQMNVERYPFMVAASESSSASLSVVHELVRTIPGLVIPK